MDKEIEALIGKEVERQKKELCLIASENYASKEVLLAMGTVLSNKYAEGYPGKRYYAGNRFIDEIENIAIERAKKLFGMEHANVQPHSGSSANLAAYSAIMSPGDKLMGLELSHGGHLTHGSKANLSGKLYSVVSFGVDRKTERIDFDEVERKAKEEKPKAIIAGFTAYPRKVDFKRFKEIADLVGAKLVADISHIAGLVAAGVHESASMADVVTTTTHKTLRGPRGAVVMCHEHLAKEIDRAVFPGMQGGPLENVIAAKAIAFREAMEPSFKAYAEKVVENAKALASAMQERGYRLVSGGTDTHLILVDLQGKLSGKEAQERLEASGIILNRNTIPYDTQSPFITSGIRMGTAAATTRGMGRAEMERIAELIDRGINGENVREEVEELTSRFPIYGDI
ncbi:MAG: serine hydroxymethyltransferase [Candidatus Anstonellales archaeon]